MNKWVENNKKRDGDKEDIVRKGEENNEYMG